jgi:uncharacterized protein
VTTRRGVPVLPAIVEGSTFHRRRGPIDYAFRHSVYQWLVDLDEMPRPPWYLRPFAGFDARDHLGSTGPDASADIKTNVERFIARSGAEPYVGGRIVMLANARVLGHVFDPLSVFWCFDAAGALRCVVAEVHNTYGERHAYLLTPDANGQADADKEFYVSPFNDVSGRYSMRFTLTEQIVRVSVSLLRSGQPVFEAVFAGVPTPATAKTIARFAFRMPGMPQKVSVLIRAHGIRLWGRRLPIIGRPQHIQQEGV